MYLLNRPSMLLEPIAQRRMTYIYFIATLSCAFGNGFAGVNWHRTISDRLIL